VAQKFVIAMMMHETNTFSPLPTPIESFARSGALNGLAAIHGSGRHQHFAWWLPSKIGRKAGAEFTVPMAASANPSGRVTEAAYQQMTTAIVDEIKKGCDAVPVGAARCHGSRRNTDDGEGELLNRIRRIAPRRADRRRARFSHANDRRHDQGRHDHRRLPHLPAHRHGRHRAARRPPPCCACWRERSSRRWSGGNRPIMSSSLVHTARHANR